MRLDAFWYESQELIRYVAIVYDCWLDFWRLWPRLCHDETAIGIFTSKTNIYLITFLISERRNNIGGGAENDENATFALVLPYPSPFHSRLCCHFLASFRFRINTEKDHIDICFCVVDQRIKVILPDVFNVLIIRNRS